MKFCNLPQHSFFSRPIGNGTVIGLFFKVDEESCCRVNNFLPHNKTLVFDTIFIADPEETVEHIKLGPH